MLSNKDPRVKIKKQTKKDACRLNCEYLVCGYFIAMCRRINNQLVKLRDLPTKLS
jgi:hypothetical protein